MTFDLLKSSLALHVPVTVWQETFRHKHFPVFHGFLIIKFNIINLGFNGDFQLDKSMKPEIKQF